MRNVFVMMLALAIGFASVATINAADDAKKKKPVDPEVRFKKMDKDKDDKLSLKEFIGKRTGEKKTKAEKQFKAKDKNKDDHLTLEEFKAKRKKGAGKKKKPESSN